MLDVFSSIYRPDPAGKIGRGRPSVETPNDGLSELIREYGGVSFNNGVYRIYTNDDAMILAESVGRAFPEFFGRIRCFGADWMGRVFAVDTSKAEGEEGMILMFEPGTGEALEISSGLNSFHDDELVNHPDAALASDGYMNWLAEGKPSIGPLDCAGYKRPLYLSGEDIFENMEKSDIFVYWDISAQILDKVRGLPEGTEIGDISIS